MEKERGSLTDGGQGRAGVCVQTDKTYQQSTGPEPLSAKARCSTGPGANVIKAWAKYTRRFMLLMAMLIRQIECYKFQQHRDDLPGTLITADSRWNVFWGEQQPGPSSESRPVLLLWDRLTLYEQDTSATVHARKRAAAGYGPELLRAEGWCWRLHCRPTDSKDPQLRGLWAELTIPSQNLHSTFWQSYYTAKVQENSRAQNKHPVSRDKSPWRLKLSRNLKLQTYSTHNCMFIRHILEKPDVKHVESMAGNSSLRSWRSSLTCFQKYRLYRQIHKKNRVTSFSRTVRVFPAHFAFSLILPFCILPFQFQFVLHDWACFGKKLVVVDF